MYPRKENPVMKRIIAVLLCAVMLTTSLAFAAGAYSSQADARPALEETFAKFKFLGDINHDGSLTASDARGTLRYSVDLDTQIHDDQLADNDTDSYAEKTAKKKLRDALDIDKNKDVCALDLDLILDLDGDGIVTAIDARIILRVSAKLENIDDYKQPYLLTLFNDSINNVKVPTTASGDGYSGCTSYYFGEEKKTQSVNISNEAALNDFSRQMNSLISTMGESESIDLATQLKEDVGQTTYDANSSALMAYNKSTRIPVYPLYECSFLTADDIKSISFDPSATYDFVSYNPNGSVCQHKTKSDLYAITIEVKDDNLTAAGYPDDLVAGTHAGKVFNIPSKDSVTEAYAEIQALQDEMNSYKDSSNWLTNAAALEVKKFVLNVNFTGLKISGSTVTLYINPRTGKPVGMDYNLKYDLNVSMYMDINLHGGLMVLYKDVIVNKQTINMTNKLVNHTGVYLPSFSDE